MHWVRARVYLALPAANVAWIRKAHTRRIAIVMSRGFDDKERDAPLRAPGLDSEDWLHSVPSRAMKRGLWFALPHAHDHADSAPLI